MEIEGPHIELCLTLFITEGSLTVLDFCSLQGIWDSS